MSELVDKPCIICSKSCAGQPRTKNKRGQYAHKACLEEQGITPTPPTTIKPVATPISQPEPEEDLGLGFPDDDVIPFDEPAEQPDAPGVGMAGFLDDLPDAGAVANSSSTPCPDCGTPIATGAVICTSCGTNLTTGKRLKKTKLSKDKGKPDAPSEPAISTSLYVRWAIGAALGASLGAAIWAGVAISFGFEIKYLATLTGATTAVGLVAVGAGEVAGARTAVIAALFTVMGLIGGRWYTNYHFVSEFMGDSGNALSLVEKYENPGFDRLKQFLADQFVLEGLKEGASEYIDYTYGVFNYLTYPDDYPVEIVDLTQYTWIVQPPSARDSLRTALQTEAERQARIRTGTMTAEDVNFRVFEESLALDLVKEMAEKDEEILWPDPEITFEDAVFPGDYPFSISEYLDDNWRDYSEEVKLARRQELADESNAINTFITEIKTELATSSFLGELRIRDFFWALSGVLVSIGIAARGLGPQ